MTTKVSRVGFDWQDADGALVKLDEEVLELREAIRAKTDQQAIAEEVGDLLFVAVNVARLTGVDPESALKAANRKFRRRFRHVEDRLRRGRPHARPTRPSRRWTASGTRRSARSATQRRRTIHEGSRSDLMNGPVEPARTSVPWARAVATTRSSPPGQVVSVTA